jgi:hypothetical protein
MRCSCRDRKHASDCNRVIAGIHTRDRESISPTECARQGLQVNASAGSCGPIKLHDERMVGVDELDGESLGAVRANIRIVGDQSERPLASGSIRCS